MDLFKNTSSQKIAVFAFDYSTGGPKTGDSANITVYVNLDWAGINALTDSSATELNSTTAPGWYLFDLTQAETNADQCHFTGKSTTGSVAIVGSIVTTRPTAFGVAGGASGGVTIAGSNAATTFAGLTTGALSCTTITASSAVAFQSTFAVTTSTALGAVSGSTVTFSGAVAFQSTFIVTGAVTFSSTFATTGTTTLNALTVTNALTISGATTLTGAVTGTNASNDLRINGAVPGAANGLFIAGSNAATTVAGLTTGALACTTITASGAVAFQSTFAVTTSTALAALSCTTLTASGAVAFQSTFATTGTTTFNAFTITNAFTVSGNTTYTGTTTYTGAITGINASNDLRINGVVAGNQFGGIVINNSPFLPSAVVVGGSTTLNTLVVNSTTTFTGAISGTNAGNDLRINGAVPGAANGLFIAGTNAATTVTTAFTTTFTGNLTGSVASIAADGITAASIDSGALTAAVWDEAISGHTTSGTFGGALNAAGAAGDPWSTTLPGLYAAGTAGFIVGGLTFDVAGVLNSNVTYVNGIEIKGTGTTLDPWNPV